MPYIELTGGHRALVDEADYRRLRGMGWHAHTEPGGKVYARAAWGNGHILMHVFLLRPPKGTLVDHKNGDGLDNRRENLRLASHAENSRNVRKTAKRATSSRYKGVTWDAAKKKWKAQIKTGGRNTALGRFATEEEAARAYDDAARELFGAFAALNFPLDETSDSSIHNNGGEGRADKGGPP